MTAGYELPEPYPNYGTGSHAPHQSYQNHVGPPETQSLLHRRHQKVMAHFSHRAAHRLEKCKIARLSELRDSNLTAELAELVGMGKNAKSPFQVTDFERGLEMFVTEDNSNCFDRNCCPSKLRPFKHNIYELDDETGRSEVLAQLRKGYGPGGITIKDGMKGNVLGYIKHHFACGSLEVEILDSQNKRIFRLFCPRSHPGLIWGKWPCGSCNTVPFFVEDSVGNPTATIANEWGGFMREFCTDSDDYFIDFGTIDDIGERLLLIAATLYIDVKWFSSCGADCTFRGCLMSRFSPVAAYTKPLVKYGRIGVAGLKVVQSAAGKSGQAEGSGPQPSQGRSQSPSKNRSHH